jgi:hypothetical protein
MENQNIEVLTKEELLKIKKRDYKRAYMREYYKKNNDEYKKKRNERNHKDAETEQAIRDYARQYYHDKVKPKKEHISKLCLECAQCIMNNKIRNV